MELPVSNVRRLLKLPAWRMRLPLIVKLLYLHPDLLIWVKFDTETKPGIKACATHKAGPGPTLLTDSDLTSRRLAVRSKPKTPLLQRYGSNFETRLTLNKEP